MRLISVLALFLLTIIFSACGSDASPIAVTTTHPVPHISTSATPTDTPDRLESMETLIALHHMANTVRALTPTTTSTPTKNRSKDTSRTPFPTRTITPTFDPLNFNTSTLASSANCPIPSNDVVPTPQINDFVKPYIEKGDLINYINTYGLQALIDFEKGASGGEYILDYQDLTNDGVAELVYGRGFFWIIGCKDNQYQILLEFLPDGWLSEPAIVETLDANHNGIPEVIVHLATLSQGGKDYTVIEWNGKEFATPLVIEGETYKVNPIFVNVSGSFYSEDIDQDGYGEYIAKIGIPLWQTYNFGIPWREEKQIYRWNGTSFILDQVIFSPPEYRFQAVQDGDRALVAKEYDQALDFYQQAVFNDQLKWWSPERWQQVHDAFWSPYSGNPTPTLPAPNPREYDHLAAYSRFKIVVHHVARGWISDAQVVYDTLQTKYPVGTTGYIYAQLAEVFWTEFNTSNKLDRACLAVLERYSQHMSEIIPYLGSFEFHGGSASIDYDRDPQYICPFLSESQ